MRRDAVQAALDQPQESDTRLHRRKVDSDESDSEEPYFYFDDFVEAIEEEYLENRRFKLHPDIVEFVACWAPGPLGEEDSENTDRE